MQIASKLVSEHLRIAEAARKAIEMRRHRLLEIREGRLHDYSADIAAIESSGRAGNPVEPNGGQK
jgi:hypothetical protein